MLEASIRKEDLIDRDYLKKFSFTVAESALFMQKEEL